jgi:prepilin-type N-terminal cleavage/methylation domain-containing protein
MLPLPAHKQAIPKRLSSGIPRTRLARSRGFSMIEVVTALAILWVGVLCAEALGTKMLATGRQSKYMALASVLASEKLEDLNRYSPNSPQVCVPTGSTSVGSLTQSPGVMQSTTCPVGGAVATVAYFDDVSVSLSTSSAACPNPTAGCFSETVTEQISGSTVYSTTYHSPDGQIITPTATSTAPTNVTFHRRWIIEASPQVGGQAITGTKRITVLVTLMDTTVMPAVNFQMSLVRP